MEGTLVEKVLQKLAETDKGLIVEVSDGPTLGIATARSVAAALAAGCSSSSLVQNNQTMPFELDREACLGEDVIDVPYLDLEDLEGMRIEAELALDLGFAGKGSIHPRQIAILNEVFTPSEDQISRARRIIAEFEAADSGLVLMDNKLIEKPVLREMYLIVSIADRMKGKR